MADKPFYSGTPMQTIRRWNVYPGNTVHIVVTFMVSNGLYYVGIEDYLDGGVWKHRDGSSHSTDMNHRALQIAEKLYYHVQKESGGDSRFKKTPEYRKQDQKD